MKFDAEQFKEDIAVDRNDLLEEFTQHPSLFAFYAEIHSRAMREEAKLKLSLEITEAKLDKAIRDAAVAAGEKVTEKHIANTIVRDAEYVKAAFAYNDARASAELAKSALEAFRQRRDMLIQLGAALRDGLKPDPAIREQVQERLNKSFANA